MRDDVCLGDAARDECRQWWMRDLEGGWGVGGLVGWCGGVIRAPAERMPKVRGRAQGGAIHHHVRCEVSSTGGFFRSQKFSK